MMQVIHVDKMCNECGNCKSFCPYDSAPYKDKFTLFANVADFENSTNAGFVLVDEKELTFKVRLGSTTKDYNLNDENCGLEKGLRDLILAVFNNYRYMF